jgi:hypothetical protein
VFTGPKPGSRSDFLTFRLFKGKAVPRAAAKALVEEGKKGRGVGSVERRSVGEGKTFVFVNNRLEGNALSTIAAMT